MILHDLHTAKEVQERVYCIIDDDKNKWDDLLMEFRSLAAEMIFPKP